MEPRHNFSFWPSDLAQSSPRTQTMVAVQLPKGEAVEAMVQQANLSLNLNDAPIPMD